MAVNFSTDTPSDLKQKLKLKKWIKSVIERHGKKCGTVSYLFTTDEKVLQINKQYLNHDFYTDIITFDYTENDTVSGDIFISADRVRENAVTFNTTFDQELHRVIIHGVLHLIGFKDHSDKEQKIMRQKEDEALCLLNSI
ncbi:MAG: rRNA maturation RNase YbeY [Bacteroidales bacterium]|nr:rRNA maturation RNase YbeY [Bacteroidales bacterium]